MGANTWRHEHSVREMSHRTVTLYLSNLQTDTVFRWSDQTTQLYKLLSVPPKEHGALEQRIDFTNRDASTSSNLYPTGIITRALPLHNAFTFVSAPFDGPFIIAGRISGVVKAVINKRDMDVTMAFYELEPTGELFNLGYYVGRASFGGKPTERHLLRPGTAASIRIRGTPLMVRQVQKGSRLVVQLSVNKNEFNQVNYGTGKDVSDESITDANVPLEVRWQNDSYVTVPVAR
jgi:uncharacterized protein